MKQQTNLNVNNDTKLGEFFAAVARSMKDNDSNRVEFDVPGFYESPEGVREHHVMSVSMTLTKVQ